MLVESVLERAGAAVDADDLDGDGKADLIVGQTTAEYGAGLPLTQVQVSTVPVLPTSTRSSPCAPSRLPRGTLTPLSTTRRELFPRIPKPRHGPSHVMPGPPLSRIMATMDVVTGNTSLNTLTGANVLSFTISGASLFVGTGAALDSRPSGFGRTPQRRVRPADDRCA